MDLNKKIEELGGAVEAFKAAHTTEMAEVKKFGTATGETSAKVDKINEVISKLNDDIAAIKTAMSRPGNGSENTGGAKSSEYKSAITSYLRKGVEVPRSLMELEAKSMSVAVDEDGGFLVSSEVSSEIVKKIFESSPMRQLASVQTISSDALEIMQDLDEVGSGWVGESEARNSTSTAKLKQIKIPVHELYAMPVATQKLLDDAAVNVEAWLAEKVAEKFARDEASAFVSGDGFNKPKGFLALADGTSIGTLERKVTATQGVFTADELIDLCYSLKAGYKKGAVWLMQRNTIKTLRKFKGNDGQYLWMPGLNGTDPDMYMGYAIMEANDMATLTGTAGTDAGKEPIAFGNFKVGYQIVDRIGIRTLRDPFSSKPNVLFYTTKRVGGGVKNFEAIKVLKLKA